MNLIHAMKKLGYIGVNDDGMCYGIAAMSASAIVRGEGDKYIERIKMIKSLSEDELRLLRELDMGPESIAGGEQKSSGVIIAKERRGGESKGEQIKESTGLASSQLERRKQLNELKAFFDGIMLYMGRTTVNHAAREFISHGSQNIVDPSNLFAVNSPAVKQPPRDRSLKIAHTGIAFYTSTNMLSFLDELKEINSGKPFSVFINFALHAVQIGFDGKKWLSTNHDRSAYHSDIREVADNVFDQRYKDGLGWTAGIEILTYDTVINMPQNNTIEPTEYTLNSKSESQFIKLLSLAIEHGQTKLIPQFMAEVLREPVKKVNGYNIFNGIYFGVLRAALVNHNETITVLLNSITTSHLPKVTQLTILNKYLKIGYQLGRAMNNGNTATVAVFIDTLFDESVFDTEDIKTNLNKIHNSDALMNTMRFGHVNTLRVFMRKILQSRNLDILFKRVFLYESKYAKEGLMKAVRQGHVDILKSFFDETFNSTELTESQKNEFIFSRINLPLLLCDALAHNQTECVKVLMETILTSGTIDEKTRFNILFSSNQPKQIETGFSQAHDNNHEKSMKTFIQTIIESDNRSLEEKLRLLMACCYFNIDGVGSVYLDAINDSTLLSLEEKLNYKAPLIQIGVAIQNLDITLDSSDTKATKTELEILLDSTLLTLNTKSHFIILALKHSHSSSLEKFEAIATALFNSSTINSEIQYQVLCTVMDTHMDIYQEKSAEILLKIFFNRESKEAKGQSSHNRITERGLQNFIKRRYQNSPEKMRNLTTQLIFGAIKNNNADFILEQLRRANQDKPSIAITLKNHKEETALMLAAAINNLELIELLLKAGARMETKNHLGETALMYAAYQPNDKCLDVIKFIALNFPEEVKKRCGGNWTALMCAAKTNSVESLRHLVNSAGTLNQQNMNSSTALNIAASWGHTAVIHELSRIGNELSQEKKTNILDLEATSYTGSTALLTAIKKNHTATAISLINIGANVNTVTRNENTTCLMVAACNGNTDIMEALINKGAQLDTTNKYNFTAIELATHHNHTHAVKLLKEAGANCIDIADKNGRTKLMVAIERNNITEARSLLKSGVNINRTTLNTGQTALMLAAIHGNIDMIKLLLSNGADITIQDSQKKYAIEYAYKGYRSIESSHPLVIAILQSDQLNNELQFNILWDKCSIRLEDVFKSCYFSLENQFHFIDLFLSKFHKKSFPIDVLIELFFFEIEPEERNKRMKKLIAFLKEHHHQSPDTLNSYLHQLLLRVIHLNDAVLAQALIESGIDINQENSNGETALIMAAKKGDTNLVELVLEHGAEINCKSQENETALMLAAKSGQLEIIQLLINRGEKVNATNTEGESPLIYAVKYSNNVESVRSLLNNGARCNHQSTKGCSALMLAVENGNIDMINLLLSNGADITKQDNNGKYAIEYASLNSNSTEFIYPLVSAIIQSDLLRNRSQFILIWHHFKIRFDTVFKSGYFSLDTQLHFIDWVLSEYHNSTEKVNKLIETFLLEKEPQHKKGLINTLIAFLKDRHHQSPETLNSYLNQLLIRVINKNDSILAQALIESGIELNQQNSLSETALMMAVKKGNINLIKLLLNHGADINYKNKKNETTLMLAAQHGHPSIIQFLLERGANVNDTNNKGESVLMYAAKYSNIVDSVKILLRYGAHCNHQSTNGHSALMLAVIFDNNDLLQHLVKNTSSLNLMSFKKFNVFHLAAKTGNKEALKILLRIIHRLNLSADNKDTLINQFNEFGYTPLMEAIGENNTETALFLIRELGADVTLSSPLDSSLSLALDKFNIKIIDSLIDKGMRFPPVQHSKASSLADALKANNRREAIQLIYSGALIDTPESVTTFGDPPLLIAIDNKDNQMIQLLLDKGAKTQNISNKDTPLMHAAVKNNTGAIDLLLDHGVDINAGDSYGWNPLLCAISYKNKEAIRLLLNHEASVHILNNERLSPLDCALREDDFDTAELLVSKGADLNNRKSIPDETILMSAIKQGKNEAVKWLLQKGARLDEESLTVTDKKSNQTVLMQSIKSGDLELTSLLLSKGANVIQKNIEGYTPLLWAAKNKKIKEIELITNHMIQSNTPLIFPDDAFLREHAHINQLTIDALQYFPTDSIHLYLRSYIQSAHIKKEDKINLLFSVIKTGNVNILNALTSAILQSELPSNYSVYALLCINKPKRKAFFKALLQSPASIIEAYLNAIINDRQFQWNLNESLCGDDDYFNLLSLTKKSDQVASLVSSLLMSRILHLSEKKSILNPSPLFNAASHNDNTLLNTFIQSIYQSDAIPAEKKYEFIKIKRNGIPQLIRALSEGATSKMHCIVTTILQCDCMPDTDKVKLLSPNFGYNCTALNRCAIKGKADTLAIFTKTIIHSSLSIDHKVSLLSSTVLKPNEKSPAYHALLNGQTHTLAQFMSSILETKKLPTQQKMLLLTEKLDIKSGLTGALILSHTETIKTCLQLIVNTDTLTTQQKSRVIASYHPQSLSHQDIEHIINQELPIEDRIDKLYNTFTLPPPSEAPDAGALKGSSPTKTKPQFFKEKAGNSNTERKSSTSDNHNHRIFSASKKTKTDNLNHDQEKITDSDKPLPKEKP